MLSFERVLVPLDGSRLAEAILPGAEALSEHLQSVLVHALEPDPPATVHGEPHLASPEDARAYLDDHRHRLQAHGLKAEDHVIIHHDSDVAMALDQIATDLDAGLIAMCAHGRGTLRGRLLGPIAQRVLRGGTHTVMLRTPGATADLPFAIRHILFPVDFRHELHAAIEAVETLARGFSAAVTLLNAATPARGGLPARMLPNTTSMLSDVASTATRERQLEALAQRMRAGGITADLVVSGRPPQDAIIQQAKDRGTDLIVLVTHGRTGVAAWYERSIGQRIIAQAGLTLLLIGQP